MLAEAGRQMGGEQQAQVQKRLSEALSCSEASATTAVKPAATSGANANTKASTGPTLLTSSFQTNWQLSLVLLPVIPQQAFATA